MNNILSDLSSWGNTKDKKLLSKVVDKKPVRKVAPKKAPPKKTTFKSSNPENLPIDPKMEKFMNNLQGIDNEDEDIDIEEQLQVAARTKKAEMTIKEEKAKKEVLSTAVVRGQLLSRDLFYDNFAPFLDRLLGDLRRLSNTFLSDVGNEIAENGGLNSSIRTMWEDKVMEVIDKAKIDSMERLKDIEKEQAEKVN